MKTIGILTFTVPHRDPRVARQIQFLSAAGHHLVVFGKKGQQNFPKHPHVHYFLTPIEKSWALRVQKGILLPLHRFETFFWQQPWVQSMWAQRDALQEIDVLIANDVETLPLAVALAKTANAKLILDAHEYAPGQFEDRWLWRTTILPFARYLCQRYLPAVDLMFTVSPGVAQAYQENFGVHPRLLYNTPPAYDLEPLFRSDDAPIKMVHHGAAIPSRRLELMIQAAKRLGPQYQLDFYLVPTHKKYLEKLRRLAQSAPHIQFRQPVPLEQIVPTLHQYDVGVFLLPPLNFNYRHALPNKFFEFIQARLAVAIGPSPDMQAIVAQEKCGVISPDFTADSFANTLSKLTHQQINAFKRESHRAAQTYTAEAQYQKLLDWIAAL